MFKIRVSQTLSNLIDKYTIPLVVTVILLFSSIIVFWKNVILTVPSGFIGVIYRPLMGGVDLEVILNEGVHLVAPWNQVFFYDNHILTHDMTIDVMTSDLLKSQATITFQYQVDKNTLPYLHRFLGPDYLKKIIIPTVETATRNEIAQLDASSAYVADIKLLSEKIASSSDQLLISKVNPPGLTEIRLVRIPNVSLGKMTFPEDFQKSIESKLNQLLQTQSYEYRLKSAKLEAERLRIEGEGIKNYQQLIQSGLTDGYLKYKGIQATQALAESPNAKIVVIGSAGSAGLPLVFGDSGVTPGVTPKK